MSHYITAFQPSLCINLSLFYFREEAGEPDSWSTLSHIVHSGDYCVKYHRGLNVYTLTAEAKEGRKVGMESDIEQLQKYIESHQHTVRKGPGPYTDCKCTGDAHCCYLELPDIL